MPSPKNIPKECTQCSKQFLTSKSIINWTGAKFCSLSCSISNRNSKLVVCPQKLFWSNVDKLKEDECWIYKKCISTHGYARMQIKGKFIFAHRFSYELHHGKIPEGMFVCHKCDNPPCVNPGHFFLGGNMENSLDKVSKNRQSKGESHGMHVLNESDVIQIKKMLKQGMTGYQIAKIFDVHHQTIYSIKSGCNWNWLHD